jgi:aspartate 1-decarboxylase
MLSSKIHRARVTDANLHYEGSITIARDIMEAAGLLPYERVEVLNINNGSRLGTYVIEGEARSGEICINGPAAREVIKGDLVIILAYCSVTEEEAHKLIPKIVYLNSDNAIIDIKPQTKGKG